jgi:lipopolysaccharide heptosyltransferase II
MCDEQLTRDWKQCKNILCIRADNMGDLLMSSPAIRALKESFDCKVTVLTSSMAYRVAELIPSIDEVIRYDLPWVKSGHLNEADSIFDISKMLKGHQFDAAVIFTVFSQNPLPSAMLAYMAGIPKRLAYCRENPYNLLTDWRPEKEPYSFIRHQVERDLDLVATVNAFSKNDEIEIVISATAKTAGISKLNAIGVDLSSRWLILHAPVSERKREYPTDLWITTAKKIIEELNTQVLLTGTKNEKALTDMLAAAIGPKAYSVAGLFELDEFVAIIEQSSVVISVNTGTVHLAAATKTPVVVLYALTNPQHTPWKVPHSVLTFEVPAALRSKNEVIQFLHHNVMKQHQPLPGPDDILRAVRKLMIKNVQATNSSEFLLAGC